MSLLTTTEAENAILNSVPLLPAEECPLAQAHGRVLRSTVAADRDQPPFDRVTLDGYALKFSAWAGGCRAFHIEGQAQAAGTVQRLLQADNGCIEIMTGAVLPAGADTVVPYEDVQAAGSTVALAQGVELKAGQAVHRRGSDSQAGTTLLTPGLRLTGREVAVAASVGAAVLRVAASPKIAVVATGDELVEVASAVAPHQIRSSNDYALRAALIAAGYPRVERFHLHDVKYELEMQMKRLLVEFDVIVLCGGVSKGKFDFLPTVLTELGVAKKFQGVRQRPGKPFWFGITPRQTPVFAVPGNPVAAYACLHRYVLPALDKMSGRVPLPPDYVALASPVTFNSSLAYLLPVHMETVSDGRRCARPHPFNTSGDFASLVGTDGFLELPWDQTDFPAGYAARYWAWV